MPRSIRNRWVSVLLSMLLALTSSLIALQPSSAAAPAGIAVDTTGLKLTNTPGLVFDKTVDIVDQNQLGLGATTKNTTYSEVGISNFSVDLTIGGKIQTFNLGTVDVRHDESGDVPLYTIWLSNFPGDSLTSIPDLTVVTKVAIRGTTNARSTTSNLVKTLLASKGLTYTGFYINGASATGSEISVSGTNTTNKDIYLSIANVKYMGVALTQKVKNIYAPANGDFWWEVGTTDLDLNWNRLGKDLSFTMSVPKLSSLTATKMALPTGIVVAPTDVAKEWYYSPNNNYYYDSAKYGDRTYVCVNLKNNTSATVNISAAFNWFVDGVSYLNSGIAVTQIGAGETRCVQGTYDNFVGVKGDVRFGANVTAVGTVQIAKAAVVDTSAVQLPKGFSINSQGVSYDADTKKSTIVVVLKAPDEFQNELRISGAKINGIGTLPKVGMQIQAGGPGMTDNLRRFEIGPLTGDYRLSNKVLALAGKVSITAMTEFDSWSNFKSQTPDGAIYCGNNYPPTWNYANSGNTNQTTINFYCFNLSKVSHTIDLSSLSIKVTSKSGVVSNYNALPGSGAVVLGSRAGSVSVDLFNVPGDVRTDGYVIQVSGLIKVTK